MPVIVQCKARSNSVNPKHIRELEGSFQGVPPHWRNKDVLGLLVTTKKATTGVMKAIANNPEEGLEEDARVSKKSQDKFKTSGTMKDIQLTWMGSPIFPDRDNLDQETLKLMRQIPANIVHVPAPVIEVEEPPQGRSKDSAKDKKKATSAVAPKIGRPIKMWSEKAPRPRGGQISGTIKKSTEGHTMGRPPGSKTKRRAGDEPVVIEKPPKPPKDPHRHKKLRQQIPTCRPRLGRPPGSKNKPKVPVDTG
ncbi:hypothetical protein J4E85_008313 [Alternaria conjuncta]|uniref:uncharacterized protein n=1 Tax=Alternaria conjuncta TaxID=181017 RepID=UPI0022208419|nr:uncharacterized protein J4E85_008313 [Alternaria conjuncta]KAI4924153.1 hypothetical protein J4E85_008313 [Alternaria conjuncta]